MDKETIALKHPFTHGGAEVKEVSWPARMTAGDILQAEAEMRARGITGPGEATQTFYLVARATGLEAEALEKMDMGDYLGLARKSQDFL